jgi:hypothetical protein
MDTLIFLPVFIAGFGCGYYLRDRIPKKRQSRMSNRDQNVAEPHLLLFKAADMRDVWRALRNIPPVD